MYLRPVFFTSSTISRHCSTVLAIPTRILLSGLQCPIEVSGKQFSNIMPPHVDLKDTEIADVLTYVRQSWSNDAAAVTSECVKQTRAKHAGRATPWTAAELE